MGDVDLLSPGLTACSWRLAEEAASDDLSVVKNQDVGHRLGYATKILNLRWVAPMFPDRTEVHTWNAASNSFMIAVNDAMGFRPVSHGIEFFRDL